MLKLRRDSILQFLASSETKLVIIIYLVPRLLSGSCGTPASSAGSALHPCKDLAVALRLSYPYGRIEPSSLGLGSPDSFKSERHCSHLCGYPRRPLAATNADFAHRRCRKTEHFERSRRILLDKLKILNLVLPTVDEIDRVSGLSSPLSIGKKNSRYGK